MALRCLILSFDYVRPKDPTISLAAASIISKLTEGLSRFGSNFELIHRRLDVNNCQIESVTEEVVQYVNDVRPGVIGAGVYVWNETYISHSFQRLYKEWNKTERPLVILGGPQITYSNRGSLEILYPFADVFIRGYSEHSLCQLLSKLMEKCSHRTAIRGVHYFGEQDLGLISDYTLEGLPSPLISGLTVPQNRYIRYETKRGCAFRCAFCQHKDSYEKGQQCCPERIQQEIQWIVEKNINDISIVDPIFNLPNSHYLKVMDLFLNTGFKGRLNLQTRLEMICEEFIQRCRHCLDSRIDIELECGVQTTDRDSMIVIDRTQSLKRIERKAEILVKNAIPFEVSLIYGLPLQTVDSFGKTIDFVVNQLKPNRIRAWPLMLLKGTELYEMKQKFNLREKLLDTDLVPMYDMRQYAGIPYVVSSSSFTEEQWIRMKSMAEQLNQKQDMI